MASVAIAAPHTPSTKSLLKGKAICDDTPLKQNSHTTESGHKDVDALRGFLEEELDSSPWHDAGRVFLETFEGFSTQPIMQTFLEKTNTYDLRKKRWIHIPSKPTEEAELYPPLLEIIQDILTFSSFKVKNRKVVSCHSTKIAHRDDGESILTTSPDFVILGHSGKNFEDTHFPDVPTYAQCVSPLEVKTNKNREGLHSHIIQVATYARQCFIEQPTRLKVYSVLLTESTVRLLQYDRGGVVHSAKCDIHKHPMIFIQIILGLASDDDKVGFDTSIYWKNGKRWLQTVNGEGESVVYKVVGNVPVFVRRTICGRGTRCWLVIDTQTGQEFLIKESWRSEEREPETTFLNLAKGLAGVGQMVAHELNTNKDISYLRGFPGPRNKIKFRNRIWCRITLKRYGKPLVEFIDGLQLLQACRDIAVALMELWSREVLHRDITPDNMLLGLDQVAAGSRGILIDFDMAVVITRQESLVATNTRTGSRAFQSVAVLRTYAERQKTAKKSKQKAKEIALNATEPEPAPLPHPHNFVDDLESIFYALCWACYQRGDDGKFELLPKFLARWDSSDAESAAEAKVTFLASPIPILPAFLQQGSALKNLLECLRGNFQNTVFMQSHPRDLSSEQGTLKETHPDARSQMKYFISLFDKAINDWNGAQADTTLKTPVLRAIVFGTASEVAVFDSPSRNKDSKDMNDSKHSVGIYDTNERVATCATAQSDDAQTTKRVRKLPSWSESSSDGDEVPGTLADSPLRFKLPKGKKPRTE